MTKITIVVDVTDEFQKLQAKEALAFLGTAEERVSVWVGGALPNSCGRVSIVLLSADHKVKESIKEASLYLLEQLDEAPVKLSIMAQKVRES